MYEFLAELPQVLGTAGVIAALIGAAFLFGTALLRSTYRK